MAGHDALRAALTAQYHASLAMLREAVARFPDAAWAGDGHANAPWQIAYHALYFTHLYLMPDLAAFRPWAGHQGDVQHPDGIAGPADPASPLPLVPEPYTRAQVLEYWAVCDGLVDGAVAAMDLDAPHCGFPWYAVGKLEHQLVSLRHLHGHTAQLQDRLRAATGGGVRWVQSGPGRP